jgi:nitrate/TMAO reductase-like tetraheme cytochrome c subunit
LDPGFERTAMFRPYRALVSFIPRLWSNWITLLGTVIASVSAVTVLVALAIGLTSSGLNAYAAAILFLVIPGLFAFGLLLIPLGLFLERRRAQRPGAPPPDPDSVEAVIAYAMKSGTARRRIGFVLLMTTLNIFIFATVTHRAVTFMETPKFCGTTCHKVMQPEYDAYNTSAHSRVSCVDCHIGSGASSMVKAKLTGLRQVWGVFTNNYHRPIETPVHNLRPANETCGNCHQANRQIGSRVGFRVHFKSDEANTPQVTAMMFHVGGADARTGEWSGIHWHASDRYQVRYEVLDAKRETIGKIQKLEGGKVVKEWLPPKDQPQGAVSELRTMDCIDCHNRATHVYDGAPDAAVEKALADGRLDRKVPWLRQIAAGVLKGATPARADAEAYFRPALEGAYARDHASAKPSAAALDGAARGLVALYRRNVYPEMNLTWNNYPAQMGHAGPDPGNAKTQCFRCHAGDRQTADGKELSSKCELCHEVIAKDELPQDLPDEIKPLLHL